VAVDKLALQNHKSTYIDFIDIAIKVNNDDQQHQHYHRILAEMSENKSVDYLNMFNATSLCAEIKTDEFRNLNNFTM